MTVFLHSVDSAEEHALFSPKNPAVAASSVKTPIALFAITQVQRFGLLLVLFDLLYGSI